MRLSKLQWGMLGCDKLIRVLYSTGRRSSSSVCNLCCSDWMCQASRVQLCQYHQLWLIHSTSSILMVWSSFITCFATAAGIPLINFTAKASVVSLLIVGILLCVLHMYTCSKTWTLIAASCFVSFRWLAHSTAPS